MIECARCDACVSDGRSDVCDVCAHAIAVNLCYETNVSAAEIKDWDDLNIFGSFGPGHVDCSLTTIDTQNLVLILDAENDVIAIVPRDKAATIVAILNKAGAE